MFSEELKELIQIALTDGVIDEQERATLTKKAAKEGIDEDELEIYIKACIQKNNNTEETRLRKSKGRKCPFCGAQIEQLANKCSNCGRTIEVQLDHKLEVLLNDLDENIALDCEDLIKKDVGKLRRYYGNVPEVKKRLDNVDKYLTRKKKRNKQGHIVLYAVTVILICLTIYFFESGQWWWGIVFSLIDLLPVLLSITLISEYFD